MNNKVILLTGSSRGLGAHVAEELCKLGYRVIINCSKSVTEAKALVDKIKMHNSDAEAIFIQADVSKRNEVQQMFDKIYSYYKNCDVLINFAGINKDESFLNMSDEQWNLVIQTILTGTFICSQEFSLRYQGNSGCIINIGAVTAIKGRKNGTNYCSARAGVLNLTRCMALELAPKINVNTVTPGYIGTDEVINRHSLHIKENYDKAVSMIPEGRLGTPDDIFKTINFLISSSSYMTGQNIIIDGGYLMR